MSETQVSADHYEFGRYVSKPRWNSIWHQITEVTACNPSKVLEIGVGAGVVGATLRQMGYSYESIDIDDRLGPTHVGSVTELPFADNSFDAVLCSQVLEHLPYEQAVQGMREIRRVCRKRVVISLPDASPAFRFLTFLPLFGPVRVTIPVPYLKRRHEYDGQHYWEIGKRGYPVRRIMDDLLASGLKDVKTYRVFEYLYHRFFCGDVEEQKS